MAVRWQIWIVKGSTGMWDGDDYSNWVAVVCASKSTAEAVAARLRAVKPQTVEALRAAGDRGIGWIEHNVTYSVLGPYPLVTSVRGFDKSTKR